MSNDSLPPLFLPTDTSDTPNSTCLYSDPDSVEFTAYIIIILLLFPLCIFTLFVGHQKWKQKRSSSSLRISHSDFLAYHAVIMELLGVVGRIATCYQIYNVNDNVLGIVAVSFHNINWCGQTCFHMLTCVGRYLAVVHPITYMSLQNDKGIRIRNISVVCVWLLCFLGTGLAFTEHGFFIANFCFLILALTITSFCSVSVLCVLIRPGHGDQVRGLEKTKRVKRRAFYTIMAILVVLVLMFFVGLIDMTYVVSGEQWHPCNLYVLRMLGILVSVPSSLILPVLCLLRAGKLKCCKRKQNPDSQ